MRVVLLRALAVVADLEWIRAAHRRLPEVGDAFGGFVLADRRLAVEARARAARQRHRADVVLRAVAELKVVVDAAR
jgi:hypothetical protein